MTITAFLLAALSIPACAQAPALESALGAASGASAAFAARAAERAAGARAVRGTDEEGEWADPQADACAAAKELESLAPGLTLTMKGKVLRLKLAYKGCVTVDKTLGEPMTPVASRLYAAEGSKWGLILSTELGSEKTFATLVYDDGRNGWRNASYLGDRPTADYAAKAKDYAAVEVYDYGDYNLKSGEYRRPKSAVRIEP